MAKERTSTHSEPALILGIILVLVLLAGFSYRRGGAGHLPDEQGAPEMSSARPRVEFPDARAIASAQLEQRQGDSERMAYDPTRAWNLEDKEYRLAFENHRAIKTYFGAPCRNYPEYQGVLIRLLENGYGIREWPEAVRAISSWSEVEHHNTDQIRLLGVPEEDIPREMDRYRSENVGQWRRCRAMLKARTGIENEELLDELMDIPLHWPFYSDPLNAGGVVQSRGEPLLGDTDWMEQRHLEAIARYQGEARPAMTAADVASTFGDEPLYVNEHEAILDREDIHPALAPFRGEDYYEHKRRLHELGEQKINDVNQVRPRDE